MKNTQKYGLFYKSNGRWQPVLTENTRQPRTFTSERELGRYINSADFNYTKNYVLKSAMSVRKIK